MINECSAACHGRSPVPRSPAATQLCSLSKKTMPSGRKHGTKNSVSLLSLFLGTSREGGKEGNIPALYQAEVTAALDCLVSHLRQHRVTGLHDQKA